ncbi:MAG TPA: HEAT repeat domain-containing protein, partial [Candidatus Saccharimonadales bacterium]|nr:HEAT repeat domain-containing protein [Candidatus Saccharimonadales bacterium]
ALYEGHKHGNDAMVYAFYGSAKGIASQPNDTNSIVRRLIKSPEEMFNDLAYPKGSWVLRMLRSQLGEDLCRKCIKTYVERHQYNNAVTENLNAVIEELSGRSFDRFFDQWVYHAHHPELGVTYTWDERTKLAKISVTQYQKLSESVLLFEFPLVIRFKTKAGTVDRTIQVKDRAEEFSFALTEAPQSVRIDPELNLLASVTFTPPQNMLYAQLVDKSDMIGRLLAVEQLSGKREALSKLREVLNNDGFHGVRSAAAKAIRAIQTDEALEVLLASTKQPDARVRKEVASAIGGFYRDASYTAIQKLLAAEKNPDIKAVYIGAMGAYQKTEVHAKLLDYLESNSYQNHLADAAIASMRAQDDASFIEPLMNHLQTKEKSFTGRGFAQAVSTLGWLGRNQEKKDSVRDFLIERLSHKKAAVQIAAINALGSLGDPKAVAVLEKISSGPRESRERTAAEKSIAAIRDGKKPAAELGALRTEVLALQKENRDLRKDFADLKKKLDALALMPDKGKTNRTAATIKAPGEPEAQLASSVSLGKSNLNAALSSHCRFSIGFLPGRL